MMNWQELHLLVMPEPVTQEQLDAENRISELRSEFDYVHYRKNTGCWRARIGPINRKLREALKEYKERYGHRCPERK